MAGSARLSMEGYSLKNPLDSVTGTLICGVILTVILYFFVKWLQPVGAS
jgi:hypothetical protein